MLVNQGRRQEADQVCQSWQSRNIWCDPLGSVFDMAAHLFIRHGLRVREILLVYMAMFFFGTALFSNPGNLDFGGDAKRAPDGPSLRQGVVQTMLTFFPFSVSADNTGATPSNSVPEKQQSWPVLRSDLKAQLVLTRNGDGTWRFRESPAELRLMMRIAALLLVPFLIPSVQRALPRLRDRRAS